MRVRTIAAAGLMVGAVSCGSPHGAPPSSDPLRPALDACVEAVVAMQSDAARESIKKATVGQVAIQIYAAPPDPMVCDLEDAGKPGAMLRERGLGEISDRLMLLAAAVQSRLRGEPFDLDASLKAAVEKALAAPGGWSHGAPPDPAKP